MRSLNLDHLRALVEVVELGSFSAAARRLGLTQPAVSLQIRELESRMAMRLLDRLGQRTDATPAGRELIDHAHAIFAAESRLLAALRRSKDRHVGRVHVGAGSAALSYLLLPVLQKVRIEHPTIDLAVTTGSTADITAAMARNTIDLGFIGLPVNQLVFGATVVRDMRMVAIFPARAGDVPPTVTPADFTRYPMIVTEPCTNQTAIGLQWLRAAGLEMRPAMEIDDIAVTKRLVALGFGAAIVPEEAVTRGVPAEGLVHRPLDPPLTETLALIRHRNRPEEQAFRIVFDAILKSNSERPPDWPVNAADSRSRGKTLVASNGNTSPASPSCL